MIINLRPGDAPLRIQVGNDDNWIVVELVETTTMCSLHVEGRISKLSSGEYIFTHMVSDIISSEQFSD